jgi:TPR repeat protein
MVQESGIASPEFRMAKSMAKKIGLLSVVVFIGFAAFILYRLQIVEERKPVKEGVAAWKNEHYAEALEKFRPAAERGDLVARFYMAQIYALGLGVEANNDVAEKWLSCDDIKSCVNGEPEYDFAYVFTNESDRYYDINKAVYWMKISSSKGYKKADDWLAKNSGNGSSGNTMPDGPD